MRVSREEFDSANVHRDYGFGIPCFSSWAPKNQGYSAYQGLHKMKGGKYTVFSRTSDPRPVAARHSASPRPDPGHEWRTARAAAARVAPVGNGG